jgi:outer membrane receptor protein involved in Fe transport
MTFNKIFSSLLTLCFVFATGALVAQAQDIQITGTILEGSNQNPIEFATVMIGNNTTRQPITGATTGPDGTFSVTTTTQDFYVEVSFIGFATRTVNEFSVMDGKVDLGNIFLSNDSQMLDEVTVRAEKSQTEFKLDKRVFNVGKDLSTTGASALEVLNNVPSVNVNIEGEISLRGSQGVQILINGKPSVLAADGGNALGTITADMIQQIEVITNPSAKYDAEGTSGIINIVIKKEERKGMNGSVSLNTGAPHNHSFGLSLNRRTEKFNLFTQLGAGYREMPNESENINRDLENNTTVLSNGTEYRNETFYNFILGTDYHIDDYNVLTLSGNFAYEVEDQPSETNFSLLDASGAEVSEWKRTEETKATNPKWQYELQYKRDFKDDKDHTLLFSALGNFFGKDQSSEFFDSTVSGSDADGTQRTRTDFQEAENTFKLDYTKPFSEKLTLETGAQYVINDVSNDYEVNNLIDGEWINDPRQTNVFEYAQNVMAVYGTGAFEGDKWGVKLGLRVENTDLNTLLANTNESNDQNYTNFFPSAHTSYKLSEGISLQAGYSRRIFRPRLWDLNPFFNIRNNFSIRTGNPDLQPEFTDSYELASIFILGKTSLNFTVYHRYTTDVVERISTFENNVNTTKPLNIGTNGATGLELNGKYTPNNWLTFTGDVNYNYFNRQGELEATSFDFNADQWSSKLTTKLKLPAGIDFEVTGQYQSAEQSVQSRQSDQLFADLGLRKKILNGKGVLNISVRDVFASRIGESITDQSGFYLYSRRQRGRFVTLGFSYGFGKGEAMEFSGARRHH